MRIRRRRPLAVVVAVAVAIAAPSCSDGGPDATEVVAASSAKTLAEESSRIAFTVSSSAGGTEASFDAEGVYDYDDKIGNLVIDLSDLGLEPAASGSAPPSQVEIVLTETVFYMKVPEVAGAEGLYPKPWVKVDLAAQADAAEVPLGGFEQLGGNDPTATLRLLGGAGDDLRRAGTETVRGAETTRYEGTLDLAKAVEAAPEEARADLQKTIEGLGGVNRLPVEVWLDDAGRVRKLRSDASPAGSEGTASVTIEYFDFGVDVAVTVPPPDQVADVSELRP